MRSLHHVFTAMALAAIVAVAVLLGAPTAQAQLPPPCGAPNLTIKNGTACNLNFCVKGTGGTFCWAVPAGTAIVVPMPLGFVPGGIVNTGNNTTYPFVPSPDITRPWWVPNITVSGCCVDVYYDPAICVMWVMNTTSPPPCQ